MKQKAHSKLGEELLERGALTHDQLQIALHEQSRTKELIGAALLRLGLVDEIQLTRTLAEHAGMPMIELSGDDIDFSLLIDFPQHVAKRCRALPVRITKDGTVILAVADPFDQQSINEAKRHVKATGHAVPHICAPSQIDAILYKIGKGENNLDQIVRRIEGKDISDGTDGAEHPVIQLVNMILEDAIRKEASDVHFEPEENQVRVRYRIDGALRQVRVLHLSHWPALSHRLKIMSGMNIADTRSIQDGRLNYPYSGRQVDIRIAVMPTIWGETISARILDKKQARMNIGDLGYSAANAQAIKAIMTKPHGIVLVTGPTGSGKTTTLYSILRELSSIELNIATLEEPVEYRLELTRQTAIQDGQVSDFASGVRGLLRMDPDIILIGEIRDQETAQMALRAAMTGHQVYSTLHCNDVFGAIPRLIDLGISTNILTGNISGLVAQRLVRKLCPHCKSLKASSDEDRKMIGLQGAQELLLAHPTGCEACEGTGRKGRTVIAEVLSINSPLDDLIAQQAHRREFYTCAKQDGFQTMQQDGIDKVLKHEICLADLARAIDMTRYGQQENRQNGRL